MRWSGRAGFGRSPIRRACRFSTPSRRPGPDLTIGELVARVAIGQSTVSHHVRVLAETGFVFHVRDGTTSRVSVNESCLSALPDAAAAVLGRADG